MNEGCGFCRHTGLVHETNTDGQWTEVPCPQCHPRTEAENQAKAQEIRDLLASLHQH